MSTVDETKMRAAIDAFHQTVVVIIEAIESAPNGLASGELYSLLLGARVVSTIQQYETLVDMLIQSGQVERRNHRLHAVKGK